MEATVTDRWHDREGKVSIVNKRQAGAADMIQQNRTYDTLVEMLRHPPQTPVCRFALVTPAFAAEALADFNGRNRPLDQARVNQYGCDILDGRWFVTGEGISFARDGQMINGQHRLKAVVDSQMSVEMLCVFGLDPEVIKVVENFRPRSLAVVAKILDPSTTNTNRHIAVAVMMMSRVYPMKHGQVSQQQRLAFIERHKAAIDFTIRDVFRGRNVKGATAAPVLAVVARAYYTQDHNRLCEFGRVILDGVAERQEDVAAISLRSYLVADANKGGGSTLRELNYLRTQRALLAFVERKPLKILRQLDEEELFSLPA